MCTQTAIAITTAVVAVLVAIITWRQWLTNRSRLQNELFNRRYAIYEKIAGFLADVIMSGRIPDGREEEFKRETKQAFFVFGCDPEVKLLISNIYKQAVLLHECEVEYEGLNDNDREVNVRNQRKIMDWFKETLGTMEKKFEKYLRLKH